MERGGLRIHNSKILGGNVSLYVNFATNMADGDLFVTGCSFDNANYGIRIQSQGGPFANVQITGNDVFAAKYAIVGFPSRSGHWLTNLVVVGNTLLGAVFLDCVIKSTIIVGNVIGAKLYQTDTHAMIGQNYVYTGNP
jgi:hypothetical protein